MFLINSNSIHLNFSLPFKLYVKFSSSVAHDREYAKRIPHFQIPVRANNLCAHKKSDGNIFSYMKIGDRNASSNIRFFVVVIAEARKPNYFLPGQRSMSFKNSEIYLIGVAVEGIGVDLINRKSDLNLLQIALKYESCLNIMMLKVFITQDKIDVNHENAFINYLQYFAHHPCFGNSHDFSYLRIDVLQNDKFV